MSLHMILDNRCLLYTILNITEKAILADRVVTNPSLIKVFITLDTR